MPAMTRQTRSRAEDRWVASRREPPGRERDERRGPITPMRVVAVVALLGSLAYVAYAVLLVRDTSAIPMLASGAVVLGIVFIALAAMGGRGMLAAGRDGRNRDAFALAIGGGIAAMIGFGCFAGAVVLALVLRGG
jgi:hypothetical protein